MLYTVYCHTCPNGKKYVGITNRKPEYRWNNGNGYYSQPFFNAINKYGWHNIKHEILYTGLSKREAERLEVELINEWNTLIPFGWNASTGGNLNKEPSDATREKMRNAKLGTSRQPHTEATKEKMSKSAIGRKMSDEARHKMSLAKRGNLPGNAKAVECITTGRKYVCAKYAERDTGIDYNCIINCCNGIQKSAGRAPDKTKLVWRYE